MKHKVILVLLDGLNFEVASHALGHLYAYRNAGRAQLYKLQCELPALSRPLYECILTRDTAFVNQLRATTHPRVLADRRDELQFRARRKNKMRPYVSDFYDQYLKMNKQPKGLATYNEVIAWLIAYERRFGKEEI